MSYEIIKSIVIKDGQVVFRSSSNNVYPKHYDPWVCTSLTKMLAEEGQDAVELAILVEYENGNFHAGNRNRFTSALERLRHMPEYALYDWRVCGDQYEENNKRRNTPEFNALVRRALHSKFPKERFIITKLYGSMRVYFCGVRGRYARWAYQKDKAKIFHYLKDAECRKGNFSGNDDWIVEPA